MIEESGENVVNADEVELLIRAMAKDFVSKLPARLEQMNFALQLCRQNMGDEKICREHLATLFRLLHSLAGSAGSFGYDGIGAQARHLEQKMSVLLGANACEEEELLELNAGLIELQQKMPLTSRM
jgi:HPt (histidine-containing phosphotransfer) domain-containing protein